MAHQLPLYGQRSKAMESNVLSICNYCAQRHTCVLTIHKEKVWACSEYNESIAVEKGQNRKIEVLNKSAMALNV